MEVEAGRVGKWYYLPVRARERTKEGGKGSRLFPPFHSSYLQTYLPI
jgi:hypothetical protein